MPGHLSRGGGDGLDGERSGMWKQMARIIGEVRPKYAFVENSPMLTSRGLGTILKDLAKLGFNAEWGVLSAADVGANHHRKRIWILGYSRTLRGQNNDCSISRADEKARQNNRRGRFVGSSQNERSKTLANTSSKNVERHELPCRTSEGFFAFGSHRWWSIEPNLDRVAHGMAARVDRLKAIGNGQVPLCAATAWRILSKE